MSPCKSSGTCEPGESSSPELGSIQKMKCKEDELERTLTNKNHKIMLMILCNANFIVFTYYYAKCFLIMKV